jgi:AcrR family transcriptional regulator
MKMQMDQEKSRDSPRREHGRGRAGQKLRTRRDLLEAARNLIDRGTEVSLAGVADEAGISRATVYRYFSDPATLALEAVLDSAVAIPGNIIPEYSSARERVHAVRRYWLSFFRNSEMRLRVLAARAMEPGPEGGPRHRRVARRLPMFVEALVPAREKVGEQDFEELALALAAASGFEIYITMKDLLSFDDERIEALSGTIIDAILEKYGAA